MTAIAKGFVRGGSEYLDQNFLSTSFVPLEARSQILSQLRNARLTTFEAALGADFENNCERLDGWDRLMHNAGYQCFSSRQLIIYKTLLTTRYYCSKPIIISSAALFTDFSCSETVYEQGIEIFNRTTPLERYIKRNIFMLPHAHIGISDQYSEQKIGQEYAIIFNFATFNHPQKSLSRDFEISYMVRPAVIIDDRILAAFNEVGLLERLADSIRNLLVLCNHDLFHAGTSGIFVQTRINDIPVQGYSELYKIFGTIANILMEEGLALEMNKRIFQATGRTGFTRRIMAAVRDIVNIMREFMEKDSSLEAIGMLLDLDRMVKYCLSNYIERSDLDDITLDEVDKLLKSRDIKTSTVKTYTDEINEPHTAQSSVPIIERCPLELVAEIDRAVRHDIEVFRPNKRGLAAALIRNLTESKIVA